MSSNTNLGNTPVNQGYVQLIHTGETGGIDGTLRTLYDGDGTASDLQIASNKVKINTELYIGSDTLQEYIQDTVGAMFSGNTETNITATYQDSDGTIDLVSSGDVTASNSVTLTNKTIDADNNTLSNIEVDNFKSGVLDTDISSVAGTDTTLASAKAIKTYVDVEVAGIVDSAPGTLNTLNELAAALGDDANFSTTTATNIATKLAKASNLSDLTNAATARSNLGVDAAGTDNSTNVTLAGSLDYITLSGQQITRNAINLTTDVTGTLPVGNGGTGATSLTSNAVLTGNGTSAIQAESSLTFDGAALNLLTTTANRRIEIGLGATQDVTSFVDLIGDTTYSDYGGRFIRYGGANAETRIMHRGTGDLTLLAQDSAAISFRTGSTERLKITSSGDVILKDDKVLYVGDDLTNGLRLFHLASNNGNYVRSNGGALSILTATSQPIYLNTNNTNRVTIASGGAITFNNAYTFPTSDGSANQVLKTNGSGTLTFSTFGIDQLDAADILSSGETFNDSNDFLMTAAAINDRIESFGYGTGDMTGVSITASNPLDISQSNTTSGSYSATISLNASEFGAYLTDMTEAAAGGDELAILDSGTLKRKAINEIRLTTFDATGFSSGISFDGSTANGLLTYKDSDEATVESALTFDGSTLVLDGEARITEYLKHNGDLDTYLRFTNNRIQLVANGADVFDSGVGTYLNTDNFSDEYRNLWTRLGYGDSGTAYWHKLCRLSITGSYKDYNMKVLWTSRYDTGTLHMHINSDNDNNIDIDYAYVQSDAFLAQSGNVKSNDHFTYTSVDASTVDVWVYTPAWREFDYIRADSITEGTPSITFYDESTTTQQTSDPGGTSFTKANVLSSNRFVNGSNNRVLTAESADTFRGESNLTFDGNHLDITNGHLVLPYGEINDSGTDLNIVGTNAITLQSESGTALTIPNASTNVILEGELFLKDNKDLVIGNGSDLEIKHDGSHNYIKLNNGNLYFRDQSNNNIFQIYREGGGIQLSEGDLKIPATSKLYLDGGGDSFIFEESANNVMFKVGNNNNLRFNSTGAIFNDGSLDLDFRVESNGDANMLFVDGGANRVGIGTGSPDSELHVSNNTANLKIESTGSGNASYLHIKGTTNQYDLFNNAGDFQIDENGVATRFIIKDSTGNIGVGTGSPSKKLEVAGDVRIASGGDLILSDSGGGNDTFLYNDSQSLIGYINGAERFRVDSNGTFCIGHTSGWSSTKLDLGATSNSMRVGGHLYFYDSNRYIRRNGDDLDYYSNNGSHNFTSGRVAIAHSDPDALLHLNPGNALCNIKMERQGVVAWRFGIDTNNANLKFDAGDDALGGPEVLFTTNGTGHFDNDVVAFSSSTGSDKRLKENIKPISYGLKEVLKINAVQYDWKEKRDKAHDIGVIAQEIEQIIPEVVKEYQDLKTQKEFKTVDYGKMVAVLIKAVQEQQEEIEELKKCLN